MRAFPILSPLGVIGQGASAAQALETLKKGVLLAGKGNYSPLTGSPAFDKKIGGIDYTLSYDPDKGFLYVPVGEAVTDVFGLSGEVTGLGAGGAAFPFDITSPDAVQQAISGLDGMSGEDPSYQGYLEALIAADALGTLPDGTIAQVGAVLRAAGLVRVGDTWVRRGSGPIIDASTSGSMQNASYPVSTITGMVRGGFDGGYDISAVNTPYGGQFINSDLTGANVNVTAGDSDGCGAFEGAILVDSVINIVNDAQDTFVLADLTRANISGSISGLSAFNRANLTDARITATIGDSLNGGSASFKYANLTGAKVSSHFNAQSFSYFDPLMFYKANLSGTDFTGSISSRWGAPVIVLGNSMIPNWLTSVLKS